MVCIAAFIILGICVLTVPIIRLFNKKLADNIVKLFKQATHCFSRRVTLRACDTSFADDVKNGLLRKVILKHPKWVKPLSGLIELLSFAIIVVSIWSLLVGVKSLVSLYVYGTCNPSKPTACVLDTAEACSINAAPVEFNKDPIGWIGQRFSDYGEAIAAIPTKMRHWDAKDYLPKNPSYSDGKNSSKPLALDIFDPGCTVCRRSYIAEKEAGFFDKYNVALLPYPIYKQGKAEFQHSVRVARYLMAVQIQGEPKERKDDTKLPSAWRMIDRMFTGKDADGVEYQKAFNLGYNNEKAEATLKQWLADFGYNDDEIGKIVDLAHSNKVKRLVNENRDIVDKDVKTKKIPTAIYDGARHDGEFKK